MDATKFFKNYTHVLFGVAIAMLVIGMYIINSSAQQDAWLRQDSRFISSLLARDALAKEQAIKPPQIIKVPVPSEPTVQSLPPQELDQPIQSNIRLEKEARKEQQEALLKSNSGYNVDQFSLNTRQPFKAQQTVRRPQLDTSVSVSGPKGSEADPGDPSFSFSNLGIDESGLTDLDA